MSESQYRTNNIDHTEQARDALEQLGFAGILTSALSDQYTEETPDTTPDS